MLRRALAVALMAGTVSSVALWSPAAHAAPAVQSVTCDVDMLLLFKPGLTFTAQNQMIRAKGNLTGCVGGGVTSGTILKTSSGSGNMSCTSGSAAATVNMRWNTGQLSQATVSVDVNGTVTGTVTRGLFTGEEVTASLSVTPLNGDCFFTPVTQAEATGSVSL
jgi:hypothetical protein